MSSRKGPLSKKIKRRAYSTFFMCLFGYTFLIYRLVDIQVFKYDKYKGNAEKQSIEKIDLNSGRGIIYDRNNKALTDVEKKKVILVPKEKLNDNSEVLNLIKESANISELEIYKAVQDQITSPIIEIEVDNIDKTNIAKLEENNIIIDEKVQRYSENGILSHTIGHLKKSDNIEDVGDEIGAIGIEKSMDEILKNSNEKYISAFRAGESGNRDNLDILEGSIKKVKKSDDERHLKLTIDYNIQKIVEDVVNKEENPTAVVISDVETGELLSICSRPNFDQNDISKTLNKEGKKNGEFLNRAISATYPPGSIFKIVVLYAALEDRIINEDYTYNCTGKSNVGDTDEVLKCHKANGHGVENIQQAFSNSCNTAFLDIAMKVGEKKILEAAKTLHLSDKVEIGIYEEKESKIPNKISIRNLAIGQESIEFSPLQVNQMTQVVANNGTYKPLYLYDSIIDNQKKIIKTFKSSKEEEIISPYINTFIKEIMKSVSEEGTAKELSDLEGGSGVKTGTAQSSLNKEEISHGWITGYYPKDNPKYAITVLVEGTEEESKPATPIFKEICEKINENK